MQKERRAPAWFSSPARAEGKGLNELDEAQYLPQSSIPSFPLMPLSMIRQVKTCVLVASQASLETQLASADFAPEEQDLVRYMETQLRALIEEQEKRHVERQVHLQLVASPGVVTKQALPSLMTKQVAKNMVSSIVFQLGCHPILNIVRYLRWFYICSRICSQLFTSAFDDAQIELNQRNHIALCVVVLR